MGKLFSILLLVTIALVSCSKRGSKVQYINISKESMSPYQSIYQVNRKAMGFPPLPSQGTVKVETVDRKNWEREYNPPNYDVMLHFYDTDDNTYKYTSRTIGLKKKNGILQWISEQMVFTGPKKYISDEGFSSQEQIVLRCEAEQVAVIGREVKGTEVLYTGSDKRLIGEEDWTIDGGDLSLEDVIPVLREWGYVYEVASDIDPNR